MITFEHGLTKLSWLFEIYYCKCRHHAMHGCKCRIYQKFWPFFLLNQGKGLQMQKDINEEIWEEVLSFLRGQRDWWYIRSLHRQNIIAKHKSCDTLILKNSALLGKIRVSAYKILCLVIQGTITLVTSWKRKIVTGWRIDFLSHKMCIATCRV